MAMATEHDGSIQSMVMEHDTTVPGSPDPNTGTDGAYMMVTDSTMNYPIIA